jgi:glycosyltransferase involved in cell wall biosynthesis
VKHSHKTPKVSVIIATYNYSSVLRYAIATVLWQTFNDFELIVVGDCCTDDSEAVVHSFGDERVRWLNLPENSGNKAIPQNAGIRVARGEYIAYLAHDDLWHPDHLETLVGAIERSGADLTYSVALYVPPPGDTRRHVSGIFPDGKFRSGYALVHSSVIHRKTLIDDVGEWPDYRVERMPGDHVFWTRAIEIGKSFFGVPKVTVWKFNASSRPDCYLHQRCDEQARYFALIRDDPALAERELIDVARSAMFHGLEPLKTYRVSRDAPPGAYNRFLRRIRGLEPPQPMEALNLASEEKPFSIDFAKKLPRELRVGERLEVELRIQNNSAFRLSSDNPHPMNFSYHWLHPDGSIAEGEGERTPLIPSLQGHSILHYFVTIIAPNAIGSYRLHPALVQEGVRWFDNAWRGEFPLFDIRAE